MIAAAACVLMSMVAQTPEEYRWPLDLPRILTSSFAEYRPGRFHAGIDLRTAGTGRAVFASRDGYVSRVRCSPWGYGRAIYVTYDDGNIGVYGHLEDYFPELREYVRRNQHAKKSYSVDLYPEAGQFKVTRGQEIAKSGQTGIGAPHLHFEMRDSASRPINPRLLGMTWPDSTAPILHSLLVVPEGPASFVNNDVMGKTYSLWKRDDGVYTCDTVYANGRIGFGIDFTDPGEGGYKLGAREISVTSGGEQVFTMRHDRLSYDNHRNAAVSYHPHFPGRHLVAFRWPGNVCDSYAKSSGDGWFDVPMDGADVDIQVTDYLGNTARVLVPVRHQANVQMALADAPAVPPGHLNVECEGTFLIFSVEFEAPTSVVPTLVIEGPSGTSEQLMRRVDGNTFRSGVRPKRSGTYAFRVPTQNVSNNSREIEVFLRGDARTAESNGVKISAPANAAYGALFARAYESPESRPSPLRKLGPVHRIWPMDSPIDEQVTITFPKPEGTADWSKVHVYAMRGSGWSRQSTRHTAAGLEITTRSFGTFAIFEDTRPPVISGVSPGNGYAAQTRRPRIEGKVADDGSGVQSIEGTVDGEWMLVSYDPERAKFEWMRDRDLPSGTHTIQIRATDAAGNVGTASRTITIP